MAKLSRSRWLLTSAAWAAFALPAYAVDGTWVGATDEWTDGTNWSTNPNVPDGTATFTNTGSASVANNGGLVIIGGVQFTAVPTAQAYTFNITNTFIVNGAGIFNNSTNAQTFNVSDSLIFQGSSTASGGSGAVNYVNAGFINFFGTSTAGSAGITNNGVLEFNDSSTAGTSTIVNNAVMDFFDTSKAGTANITNNGTLTFSISGSADHATIINTNTLNFTGSSTADNASITNNAGSTTFADGSSAGTSTITNNAAGNLFFADTSGAANARVFNNAGGSVDISQTSAGVSIGSVEGAGQIFLGSMNLTLGNTGIDAVISGAIADGGAGGGVGGSLTKIGNGMLTLSGVSTYTGNTNVNAGTLIVDGSLLSPVIVNAATLGGVGTVGGLTANSGGTVAPGTNSIANLNVAGNVTFNTGSFYRVDVNAAGQSNKIAATGTATLNGGTVQVQAQAGAYAPSTIYSILTGGSGRSGNFAGVTTNMAFLVPSLSYVGNDVLLTLTLNMSALSSSGQTPNQRAVSGAIGASPPGSALVQAVQALTTAQAQQALDALSGEIHGSAQTALATDTGYFRQAILGRLRVAPYWGEGATAPLGLGGPETAYAAEPKARSAFAADAGKPWTLWAQAFGSWASFDSDGNAARLRTSTAGAFSGVDTRVGAVSRLGFAAGYTHSRLDVSDRASSADVDTAHAAVYGGTSLDTVKLRGGASFSWSELGTNRTIAFPGFFETAKANYHAGTTQVFGEAGYGFVAGRLALEPFAGLAWQHIDTGGFSETGGVAALNASSNHLDVGYSTLGVRSATVLPLSHGMVLVPRATLAWQHAFNDTTPGAALAFASTGAGFNISGVPLARDSALAEASVDLKIDARTTIGLSFIGQFAENSRDAGVKGKATWIFN